MRIVEGKKVESACKPGSVENSHSSGMCVTTHLKQPTRKHARAALIASLFGLAPGGVYPATVCCHRCGALLPHLFTLTCARKRIGGIFSAALSVGFRLPGVTWRHALWSPDFPPPADGRQRLFG